ncbi:MAG: EF-P lysine aminoacylase EpmA [Methylomonas sp.]|nr:EF-P lysine aminoacylase EpmA [Methylomonas sp.]
MSSRWRPAADMRLLRRRAQLLADIRLFFADRAVLEVETPLLCGATGTDPNLDFFSSQFHHPPQDKTYFLQTSPEFAMKRLLAAGSGSIYQICKAFRNGESGRLHNPEFTILEWYRVGFDLEQLMAEVVDLLVTLLASDRSELSVHSCSYRQIFTEITDLDPLSFDRRHYRQAAAEHGLAEANALCGNDHAVWLDFLFSHLVQPSMPKQAICLVFGYPAIQSSLARINAGDPRVADRFEVFIDGMELANGFFELNDVVEQETRFEREMAYRHSHGLAPVAKDALFLDALKAGLPVCSGVAMGLDRLLMVAQGHDAIDRVLAFPFDRA